MHITILEQNNLRYKTKENIMSTKECINNTETTKYTYTGREKSPLGRGFSAALEKVGTIMKGVDDNYWMVIINNRVQVWSKVPTDILKKDEPVIELNEPEKIKKTVKTKAANVAETEPEKEESKKPVKKTVVKKKEPEIKLEVESKVEPEPELKKEELKKPVKKTVAKKKQEAEPEPKKDDDEPKPKKVATKKYTDYNYFMMYQMKHGNFEDMKHTQKLSKIAEIWKSKDEKIQEENKQIVEKAKKEFVK